MSQHDERRAGIVWLYNFLWPERRAIAGLFCLSLTSTGLIVAQPWVTKLIIDDGLIGGDFGALWPLALLGLLLAVMSILLAGFSRLAHTRLSGTVLFALREDVFSHVLKLSPDFLSRQRVGDIISRMDRDVAEIQRFAVDTLFSSVSSILGLIGAVTMMLLLNWKLSLVLLLLIPLELSYLVVMRPKVERRNRRFRERSADISAFFAEKLPAVKMIQLAGTESREGVALGGINTRLLQSLLGLQRIEFMTSAVPSILVSVSRTGVFLLGGFWVIQGEFEVGSLIAFTTYVGMAIGPVQSLLGLYLSWQRLTVSLDRVAFLRRQPTRPSETSGCLVPQRPSGTLSIEGLCFAYPDQAKLFEGFSFDALAGSKVGIWGKSGSGKTTLLDLITGYRQPLAGDVMLNGCSQHEAQPRAWREAFGVAPQDPVLFHATLRDNLLYGCREATATDVDNVIVVCGLTSLLEKLSDGLDTMIAERGVSLSGGERQRIAVARALLKKPQILVLDEPISAADPDTGRSLIAAIDLHCQGMTRLIVSHREEALVGSDVLIRFEEGGIEVLREDDAC